MEQMIDFQNLIQMQMQNNQSFMENVENKEMRRLPPPESQLNLDFFQDDNEVKKNIENHQQNIATQKQKQNIY